MRMMGGKWSVVRDQVVGGDETATKRNVWNDFVQHHHQSSAPSAHIVWYHVKSCEISNIFFMGQDLISSFIIASWNITPVR